MVERPGEEPRRSRDGDNCNQSELLLIGAHLPISFAISFYFLECDRASGFSQRLRIFTRILELLVSLFDIILRRVWQFLPPSIEVHFEALQFLPAASLRRVKK